MTKRYSLRLSAKDKGVKIFNNHDENNWRVLNLHFNDYEDAQFVRGKLEPVVDLLNSLSDENEELREQIGTDYNTANTLTVKIAELSDKNEHLKSEIENNIASFKANNRKRLELEKENEQLKKDVEYWKQVALQYSNELNVFEHCKKYKTECKDIHWSSD